MNSWDENRACYGRFIGLIRGVNEGVPFASRIGLTDAPVVKIARRIGEGVPPGDAPINIDSYKPCSMVGRCVNRFNRNGHAGYYLSPNDPAQQRPPPA